MRNYQETHDLSRLLAGVASVEACAALCASAAGCSSFHYYGPGDPAAGLCYLHARGVPTGPLGDGRQRYAGNCTCLLYTSPSPRD